MPEDFEAAVGKFAAGIFIEIEMHELRQAREMQQTAIRELERPSQELSW